MSAGSPLSEVDAARITGQLLTALAALHQQRLCHMDIKPENIMFENMYASATHFPLLAPGLGPAPGPAPSSPLQACQTPLLHSCIDIKPRNIRARTWEPLNMFSLPYHDARPVQDTAELLHGHQKPGTMILGIACTDLPIPPWYVVIWKATTFCHMVDEQPNIKSLGLSQAPDTLLLLVLGLLFKAKFKTAGNKVLSLLCMLSQQHAVEPIQAYPLDSMLPP